MKISFPIIISLALSVIPLSSAFAGKPAVTINACNEIIQSPGNYELANDLNCVDQHAIRIDATRVKLSLNGYTISGDGSTNRSGIWVQSGSRITISGPGRITGFNGTGFSQGILISTIGGDVINRSSVSGLIVDNNRYGISLSGANTSGVVIKNNIVKDNEVFGIDVAGGAYDNTIERNEVLNNGNHGIYVAGGAGVDNTITNNNASYNGTGTSGANIIVGAGSVGGTAINSNIAIYAAASDILDQGGGSTLTNNTCFVGAPAGCPRFGNFDINH